MLARLLVIGLLLVASGGEARAEEAPRNVQFRLDIPAMIWEQDAAAVEWGYSTDGTITWLDVREVESNTYAVPLGSIPYGNTMYIRANQVVYGPYLYGPRWYLPLVAAPASPQ